MSLEESARRAELNKRLENLGWGTILVVIGTIGVLPEKNVPHGTWLIAAGLILLGLNVIRYINGIEMKGLSLALGVLALLAGLGKLFGLQLPLFAIALIVVGVLVLLKTLFEGRWGSDEGSGLGCCGPREGAAGH